MAAELETAATATGFDRLKAILGDPPALLPLVAVAYLAVASAHLIADVLAFSDDFAGQLAGVLVDLQTLVAGAAVLAALVAVVDRPLPEALRGRALLRWVDRVRSDPDGRLTTMVGLVVVVGTAQTLMAVWHGRDETPAYIFTHFFHDVFFNLTAAAVVVALTARAVHRLSGAQWERAARARQFLMVALYAAPAAGLAGGIFWLINRWGEARMAAVSQFALAALEAVAAAAILAVLNVMAAALFPLDPDGGGFAPRGRVGRILSDPRPFLDTVLRAGLILAVIHVLGAVGAAGTTRSVGFVSRAVFDGVFDVTAIMAVLTVVRAAAHSYGPLNTIVPAPADDASPDGSMRDLIRTLVYVVAYLGVFSAIVSAWVFRGDAGEVWYYLFNRMVRTAAAVGVLLALRSVNRQTVEPVSA